MPSLIVLVLVPVGLLGGVDLRMNPLLLSGPLEMWIVNGLAGSATLLLVLSIIGCAMCRISSSGRTLRWLVKLSYPIYVFHLMFVISVSGTLMFFGVNDWIVVLLGFAAGIFSLF